MVDHDDGIAQNRRIYFFYLPLLSILNSSHPQQQSSIDKPGLIA